MHLQVCFPRKTYAYRKSALKCSFQPKDETTQQNLVNPHSRALFRHRNTCCKVNEPYHIMLCETVQSQDTNIWYDSMYMHYPEKANIQKEKDCCPGLRRVKRGVSEERCRVSFQGDKDKRFFFYISTILFYIPMSTLSYIKLHTLMNCEECEMRSQ